MHLLRVHRAPGGGRHSLSSPAGLEAFPEHCQLELVWTSGFFADPLPPMVISVAICLGPLIWAHEKEMTLNVNQTYWLPSHCYFISIYYSPVWLELLPAPGNQSLESSMFCFVFFIFTNRKTQSRHSNPNLSKSKTFLQRWPVSQEAQNHGLHIFFPIRAPYMVSCMWWVLET